jgi:hypothetical protein
MQGLDVLLLDALDRPARAAASAMARASKDDGAVDLSWFPRCCVRTVGSEVSKVQLERFARPCNPLNGKMADSAHRSTNGLP